MADTELTMLKEMTEERGRPDYAGITTAMIRSVGLTMSQVGEIGQIGIVWFSIGVAVWQLLLIARNLVASGSSPLRDLIGRSLLEAGKEKLVSGNARSMIEMSYWLIKFIEDFEKQYKASGLGRAGEAEPDERFNGEGQIWSPNARTYLKMMRYVSKFLSTQEKFQKNIKPRNIQF